MKPGYLQKDGERESTVFGELRKTAVFGELRKTAMECLLSCEETWGSKMVTWK